MSRKLSPILSDRERSARRLYQAWMNATSEPKRNETTSEWIERLRKLEARYRAYCAKHGIET